MYRPVIRLFNLAVVAPSTESSDNAIKTVQRAYLCSIPGVPDSIVQELRPILLSLHGRMRPLQWFWITLLEEFRERQVTAGPTRFILKAMKMILNKIEFCYDGVRSESSFRFEVKIVLPRRYCPPDAGIRAMAC
ncbi:hypothetical protein EDD18DRAFT_130959 [Armillaria luteobubalina]|uniref:Uncharacterized protein n=1 Tax=Armillaria luteobubalina TaxID=153913 RepID=A0AA39QA09_9AGAR|nr:hypothetical protein EDD18DRAFT_130959 [Armillaria luteobubalina]